MTCRINVCLHCSVHKKLWHCGSLLWLFHLNRLGTCSHMLRLKTKIQLSLDELLWLRFLVSVANMIMTVIALLIVASQSIASFHIVPSMSSTRASKSLKTKLFQRVHYKFLCMVFQTIPSKFSCATFKTFKILLILWHCFSSWGSSSWVCYLPY